MSASTTRLSLTMPGGGSHGDITPGEPVDIDVINDNMRKLDAAAGAINVTSTTRPSAPFTGQLIYETDTQSFSYWNGTAWSSLNGGTWTDFSSTANFSGMGGGTTVLARWMRVGKHVFVEYVWRAGSSPTIGNPLLTLPAPVSAAVAALTLVGIPGMFQMLDASAGAIYTGTLFMNSNATQIRGQFSGTNGGTVVPSGTVPFTAATGDEVRFFANYSVD